MYNFYGKTFGDKGTTFFQAQHARELTRIEKKCIITIGIEGKVEYDPKGDPSFKKSISIEWNLMSRQKA